MGLFWAALMWSPSSGQIRGKRHKRHLAVGFGTTTQTLETEIISADSNAPDEFQGSRSSSIQT